MFKYLCLKVFAREIRLTVFLLEDISETSESKKHILCVCVCVCVSHLVVWTVACQAPLSMKFSRQEYWSELPFASPGDLPDPGIRPRSPALQAGSLPSELPRKLQIDFQFIQLLSCVQIFETP